MPNITTNHAITYTNNALILHFEAIFVLLPSATQVALGMHRVELSL